MTSAHIEFDGRAVAQGETFEPRPGYEVTFVRMEPDRLILRDAAGEFSRPIKLATARALPPRKVNLGERRTVVEEDPDGRPIENGAVYIVTHQIAVPGGWETVISKRFLGPKGQAGVYGPAGQMMDITELKDKARLLFQQADKKLAKHPYTLAAKHVTTLVLQEGTAGEPGAWDDLAVPMELARLLRDNDVL
ncbi:hypothetical protein [Streptomyces werraensis]|uniref:hypothetical protein n=1 Tax=Streptomyces werraensis TaxID=68284 RepID=UPI00341A840D